jgi:hypothetical protein
MSNAIKSGSLDFGDLKSGGGSSAFAGSPGFQNESDKAKVSSPRSPVGRTDKRLKDTFGQQAAEKKSTPPMKGADNKGAAKQETKKEPPKREVPIIKENVG